MVVIQWMQSLKLHKRIFGGKSSPYLQTPKRRTQEKHYGAFPTIKTNVYREDWETVKYASTKRNGCFKVDEKIYPLVENYACHHQRAQTGQVVSKAENITEF
ncbi:hypothetical protein P5673_026235 [Acropora cervicornis]|uniref:Uncharacterized protein n=1 Tax=Acropora cervicornis TaxID=6130 RepID=A0AAD9Q0M9_ACRCE|nr:hypothetical protein P5673_026235 [Acropora cervicornis]